LGIIKTFKDVILLYFTIIGNFIVDIEWLFLKAKSIQKFKHPYETP
jgi:hypothetical protein